MRFANAEKHPYALAVLLPYGGCGAWPPILMARYNHTYDNAWQSDTGDLDKDNRMPRKITLVLILSALLISYRPIITSDGRCLFDFDTFAYKDFIHPLYPWEDRQNARGAFAKFSRMINGQQELWFLTNPAFPPQRGFVFNRDTKIWRELNLSVIDGSQDSQFEPVFNVIADHDGKVWGLASQSVTVDGRQRDKPVIVKYREAQADFAIVFIPDSDEVRSSRDTFIEENYLLVDPQNRVWFIVNGSDSTYEFYVYDQSSETFSKLSDYQSLGNYNPHITISANGDVYVSSLVFDNWPPYYNSSQAEFMRYDAEVKRWVGLELPDGFQPREGNLGFDLQGRLHIGTSGWRDIAGEWHITAHYPSTSPIIYPRIELKFISSDGRMWFTREDRNFEGTAWYHPSTGTGCVFTNLTPYTIIEDHNQYLWMVVDGSIYRLNLNAPW